MLITTSAFAQDDDEQPPGLHARYQVGQSVVERVDPDIAFVWDNAAPDDRLPPGKFTAHWSGTLLLRSQDKYRFHAFVQGRVSVKVNQQVVLDGETDRPGWISGPETALTFGDQTFNVSFAQRSDAAQLKLFWSSTDFPLEPLPYHVLFQAKPSPELTLAERGRVQFEAFRCGNCHTERGNEPSSSAIRSLAAPSLKHVGIGTSREWLIEKLKLNGDPKLAGDKANVVGKMPQFGLSRDEAEAVIATLASNATPVELMTVGKPKDPDRDKELRAGRTLIRSIGCLACHTWDSLGENTPFGGGSLNDLARKRTEGWLTTWLSEPARLNPHHRMPVLTLTAQERTQIVLTLLDPAPAADHVIPDAKNGSAADEAVLSRGKKLIEASRCVFCHELPVLKPNSVTVLSLAGNKTDWSKGCTQSADRSKSRPGFPQSDLDAIRAYVATWQTREPTSLNSLAGRKLLEQKNCLGCHDRDQERGISRLAAAVARSDETLAGLHMTLIPPRLNSVGDRMHDGGLIEAIRGEQKSPRLNWLRVRMPRFQHTPTEQAALIAHLIGHDRIPEGSPEMEPPGAKHIGIGPNHKPDPQRLLAGRELLGGKGFSCVACHAVKDYTPKVTALGTRGSNLHLIGQRMRTDYFFRWTRAPLRVMPGVEMPNYQRPHEFILPGQLDQQLIAVWDALNDPNLTAPTNSAVVEQLLAVGEKGPPRVVRDVFTVPGTTDETVARAYAVGLPGGHSVLFDLETCSVRGWTLGDFARQRCEGKRWYWDLAGSVMAARFDKRPDIILVHQKTGEVIAPETGWTAEYQFDGDYRDAETVMFRYDVTYSKNGVTHKLKNVVEQLWGRESNGLTGWRRNIRMAEDESGTVWPWFRNALPEVVATNSRITIEDGKVEPVPGISATTVRFSTDRDFGARSVTLSINYQTSLRRQNPILNVAPTVITRPDRIKTTPGFRGERLPFPKSIMPTAMTWDSHQRLLFTSLKGHLYRVKDSDDGQPSLSLIDEGLAAPFGVIEHQFPSFHGEGPDLVVAHKPELLRLIPQDDGNSLCRFVIASGWGLTDDYHDWACGVAHDSQGNLFIGLGSDYTFKNRPAASSKWRGDILRIAPHGKIESIARGLRYPTGLAIDDQDRLFCTDQQGVQNTFNELNCIQVGRRYGVPSRHDPEPNAPADPPAVQIPHPWTRSVNGIVWISKSDVQGLAPLSGHFLGCEYNNNMLIRMSVQTVGDVVQGAVYPFSKPCKEGDPSNFVGPICIGISPHGEIYVGGFQDGGWVGGLNMGDIVKLTPSGDLPNGIREIRATQQGFDLQFFHEVDPKLAVQTIHYKVSGYTRIWKGDYATPDSGHHIAEVTSAALSNDGRSVALTVYGRKTGHVYDVSVGDIGSESQRTLWPAIGHYTLHRIPDQPPH